MQNQSLNVTEALCLFYTLISYLLIRIRILIQFWTRIHGRQMNIDPTGNGSGSKSKSKSTSLIRTSELNELFSRAWGTKLMMVAFEVILEPFEVNFGAIWIQQKILVLKIDFARKYFFFCMYDFPTYPISKFKWYLFKIWVLQIFKQKPIIT